jgi:coenzyme F420-reducing hydrogenase beta subunit
MAKRLICAVCGKTIVVSECIDFDEYEANIVLLVKPCDCSIHRYMAQFIPSNSNFLKQEANHIGPFGDAEINYPLKYC